MKIITWNVNSLKVRMTHLERVVELFSPEIILLQELKSEENKLPIEEILDLGYNIAAFGQKTYNGVAILSKGRIYDVEKGLLKEDNEARYIKAITEIEGKVINVASVYVPNGSSVGSEKFAYKLNFLETLKEKLKPWVDREEIFIIGGDMNVSPKENDVYDPKSLDGTVGFHIEERKRLWNIIDTGMSDAFRVLHPNVVQFSWWDYRTSGYNKGKGMRLDSILINPYGMNFLEKAQVIEEVIGWKRPSDHAPVLYTLTFN